MRRFLVALCALISLPAAAAAADDFVAKVANTAPPQEGVMTISPGTVYTFDARLHTWCAVYGFGVNAWANCAPEYTIPPDQLRALRIKAGLDPDAPVYTPPALTCKQEK